jgi:hypothetical protein
MSVVSKIPASFVKGLGKGIDPEAAWRGFQSQSLRANDESLLAWPFRAAAEKILGRGNRVRGLRKVRGGMWKHVGSRALRADMEVGRHLQKIPGIGKSLFTMKEDIPWKTKGTKKTITRASALAPLTKVRDIATPVIVGVGLESGIKALKKKRDASMQDQQLEKDQQLREKVASVMLSLHERNKEHEKRAHALKLLYKQAELGYAQLPQTHRELEEKLASLVLEDLVVLEKALELAGGNIKLGELGRSDPKAEMRPAEKFQAVILGEDF